MTTTDTLFEIGDVCVEGRKRWRVGDRLKWPSAKLGVCVGRVVGVHETQLRARRDGVAEFSNSHHVSYTKAVRIL